MTRGSRLALLALLLALAALGLWALWPPGPGSRAAARWTSSRQCAECHQEVAAEWQGSHHQIAYVNPEVRKLSDDFRNPECRACHLPRPVLEVGLGLRTLPRRTRPDEGVDCLACHATGDGGTAGTRALPGAPCAPRAEPALRSVTLCESCHNQHGTTDQFRASKYAAQERGCNGCHMPTVRRANGREGRGHAFPGAHDAGMLRAAVALDARLEGGEVAVAVENRGAGHSFPTEERHRAADVLLRFLPQAGGDPPWTLLHRFRQPYRDEPGENTQLPAGETRVLRAAVPGGTAAVEVRLWYRLNPFAVDGDAASTLLLEQRVEVP